MRGRPDFEQSWKAPFQISTAVYILLLAGGCSKELVPKYIKADEINYQPLDTAMISFVSDHPIGFVNFDLALNSVPQSCSKFVSFQVGTSISDPTTYAQIVVLPPGTYITDSWSSEPVYTKEHKRIQEWFTLTIQKRDRIFLGTSFEQRNVDLTCRDYELWNRELFRAGFRRSQSFRPYNAPITKLPHCDIDP